MGIVNRKKIIIVSHALEIGGAERSLIGLLNAMKSMPFDVDLFLLRQEGELLKYIPDHINLLPEVSEYTVLARPMKETLREGHLILTFARLIGKISAKRFAKKRKLSSEYIEIEYSHKYTYKWMPMIQANQEYDLAISFLTPHYIVANKINAKKKIAWIHTDYSQIDINIASELNMWKVYDHIVSISESVKISFLNVFPILKDKIIIIENILPISLIVQQSKSKDVSSEMSQNEIRLLSIGRFCFAKNFDSIPKICRGILELGCNIKWYIIGFGNDEPLIREKISEFNMKNHVILLGKKENPYPYIKKCDWYIQPSRFEGKAVTVREAQILHKPVIITDYPTAQSQLIDGVDGIIVPLDSYSCAYSIATAIKNIDLTRKLIKNTYSIDYSGYSEIEKLNSIIEE